MSESSELKGNIYLVPKEGAFNLRFSFSGSIELGDVDRDISFDLCHMRSAIYASTLDAVEECINENKGLEVVLFRSKLIVQQ